MSDPRETSGFFGLTVARPIAMGVLFVTLVLVGLIAYSRIPLQFLPGGISGSRFSVYADNDGSTAQENADKVARVLEEQFETIPGVESVRSRSSEDSVRVRLEYTSEVQPELAKAEIRDRIERARADLPDTVDRVRVWASDDGDMPIMWFAIRSTERSEEAAILIDTVVQKRLESVDGVSRVNIWGLLDDSIRIFIDQEKAAAARIDLGALIQRLRADNSAQPLGEIAEGGTEFILRSDMRFRDLREIEDYPVSPSLALRDIATVERVNSVRDRITRINGDYAYYGFVQKEGSANVVAVGEELSAVMEGFDEDPQLAGRISASVFFNQADFIKSSLDRLKGTAIQGGGLAILVLFMFLRRARMTLCVALCIPVSALLAVAFESFGGGSFNILTMTGLTLGLGMLVDNAVVVVESIARQRGLGRPPRAAAVLGSRDVGLAVALATMTSVVVFVPLMFMGGGRMGVFLQAMGVPLCASLVFSLLIALVFVPTAAARASGDRPRAVQRAADALAPIGAAPARLLAYVVGGVRVLLYGVVRALHAIERFTLFTLGWPGRIAAAAAVAWLAHRALGGVDGFGEIAGALEAVDASERTTGALRGAADGILRPAAFAIVLLLLFVPFWRRRGQGAPARPERFVPAGSSIVSWVQALNRGLLAWTMRNRPLAVVLSFAALGTIMVPAQNTALTAFGEDEDTSELEFWVDLEDNFTLAEASDEFARYEELLEPYRDELGFENLVVRFSAGGGEVGMRWPERLAPDVIAEHRARMRRELPDFAGHRVRFRGEGEISETSKQFVSFELRGPDPERLAEMSEEAVALLERVPGLEDVTGEIEDAPDQVMLDLDAETAFSYGLNSQRALQSVAWNLRGTMLPRFQEEDREVPFLIEIDRAEAPGLDALDEVEIFSDGAFIPLTTFSDVRFQPAPSRIYRRNGQVTTSITARVTDPTQQGRVVEDGYEALAGLEMPRGYSLGRDDSVVVRGAEEVQDLQNAAQLSIVLVFLLMGILFESLLLPFSVLTTIPFAMLGAFWTLYVSGTPMDSIGWIGIIILVGVVVNNGIVLIDKIHRLRFEEGLSRSDAVIEGASARVRPILMTALTTVFGLLPMALGDAPAQGIDYRALATCVAGGLAVCTFFTLWVVPLAYTLLDDLGARVRWITESAFGDRGAARGARTAPERGSSPHPAA